MTQQELTRVETKVITKVMTNNGTTGPVLWFTGLSGAGKTTTARYVEMKLQQRGLQVEMLDGDELRQTICKGLGFSREDRIENIRRIAYLSKMLSRNGVIVLVSTISPYREMREYARNEIANFAEVYIKCPIEECERRDVKGMYAKARNGEIAFFTGITDPYEEPERPEIIVRTDNSSIEENGRRIISWIDQRNSLMFMQFGENFL